MLPDRIIMKYKVNLQDFNTLREMGYTVTMFMPWHYRISVEYRDFNLDIFPTRRTYIKRTKDFWSKKQSYNNLVDLVETILN